CSARSMAGECRRRISAQPSDPQMSRRATVRPSLDVMPSETPPLRDCDQGLRRCLHHPLARPEDGTIRSRHLSNRDRVQAVSGFLRTQNPCLPYPASNGPSWRREEYRCTRGDSWGSLLSSQVESAQAPSIPKRATPL